MPTELNDLLVDPALTSFTQDLPFTLQIQFSTNELLVSVPIASFVEAITSGIKVLQLFGQTTPSLPTVLVLSCGGPVNRTDQLPIARNMITSSTTRAQAYIDLTIAEAGLFSVPSFFQKQQIELRVFQLRHKARQAGMELDTTELFDSKSRLRYWLPLADPENLSALPAQKLVTDPAQAPVRLPDRSRPCILLVEDEPRVQMVIMQMLELLNFDVLAVADADTALESIKNAEASFHLIVLDITLPGMDGLTFAQQLRQQNLERPILWISGLDWELFAANAPEWQPAEHSGFLKKPFTLLELKTGIQNVLSKSNAI